MITLTRSAVCTSQILVAAIGERDCVLLDFIVDTALPLFGTISVGALGWCFTHWIAFPIAELKKTRRLTYEELLFYRNLSKDWKPDKISEGKDSLRRLAARIDATSATSSRPVRWYYRHFRGWDLANAQSALRGLSNVQGTTRDQRTILRHDVENALKFPLSDDPERIELIKNLSERNGN